LPTVCEYMILISVRSNGKTCLVRIGEQVRENIPKTGSNILVKHSGLRGQDSLKNPFFWREISFSNSQNFERAFWENIGKALGVKQFEDWYRISTDGALSNGENSVLHHFGNDLIAVLSKNFPGKYFQHFSLCAVLQPRT
jgi:hypothetical protein